MSTVMFHDLRAERRRLRRQQFQEARKPKTSLESIVAEVQSKSRAKAEIDIETLDRLDAVLTATEQLMVEWPVDAQRIARGLLLSLLRMLWVKTCGKPLSNPEPSRTAMKLFQKNAIDKVTMRRITTTLKTDNAAVTLDCCRGLLVLLAR